MATFALVRSARFKAWFDGLADRQGKNRIVARLIRLEQGNSGDCAPVGEGVSEMRMHFGPGYRIYFVRRGGPVVYLLTGGDKRSQARDIDEAKAMARELREEER